MKHRIATIMLLAVACSLTALAQQQFAPLLPGKRPVFDPKHDPAGKEAAPIHGNFPEMQIPLEPLASNSAVDHGRKLHKPQNNDLFEVGLMANTWCMIGEDRNQIACDPRSGTIGIVFRGNDRGETDGNTLYVRYSTDGGASWTPRGDNLAASSNPRYPNLFLPNAGSGAHTAMTWAQIVQFGDGSEGLGEIHSMKAGIGNSSPSYAKFAMPPNWDVTSRILMNQNTGDLYTMSEAIEPSNGDYTGEIYLFRSSDGGASWQYVTMDHTVFDASLIPEGYFANNLRLDISPDGSTMIAAVMFVKESEPGMANIIDERHEIAYRMSTNGGQSWSAVERLRPSELGSLPAPFSHKMALAWDLDVMFDYRNRPHFLVVGSADLNPFSPRDEAPTDSTISLRHVDSTFTTEITPDDEGGWRVIPIGPVRRVRTDRMSFTAGRNDDTPMLFRSEAKWARTWDGTRLFAQWISPYWTWKVDLVAGQPTLFQDTVSQIYVNGRHVDNLAPNPWAWKWDFIEPDANTFAMDSLMRVTASVEVAAKYTKMAYYASEAPYQLHILYVEWGIGETLDDDPVNSDQVVWYVQDVTFDPFFLDVEQIDNAPGSFALAPNYPNPFNPSTELQFTLPATAHVSLRVYDLLGREVATLVDQQLLAGTHRASFDAAGLPSGMYIARLESAGRSTTRKMMLSK